jgi:hypothetical protein
MQIAEHKKILASLFSKENIQVIFDSEIKTARFDSENRVIRMPCYAISEEMMDMLIAHESGHAVWSESNQDKIKEMANRVCPENTDVGFSYLNIVEDIRIEKLLFMNYKGIKYDFFEGYRQFLKLDLFGLKKGFELSLIDKINVYFKTRIVDPYIVTFTDEEMPFVEMCENIKEDSDIVDIARQIFEFCRQNQKDSKSNSKSDVDSDEDNIESSSESAQETEEDSKEQPTDTKKKEDKKSSNESIDSDLLPKTDKHAEKTLQQSLTKYTDVKYFNCPSCQNLPIYSYLDFMEKEQKREPITQYIEDRITEFNLSSKDCVNVMVQQFMTKKAAREFERSLVQKTGTLNTNKLSQFKITEDIFVKQKFVQKGKSHAMIFFIDWSTSMARNIEQTLYQLYEILLFCRKMNIPFEVFLFSNRFTISNNNTFNKIITSQNKHSINISLCDFVLIHSFSSNMRTSEFVLMQKLLLQGVLNPSYHPNFALNTTPLDECIITAIKLVTEYRKATNIEIVNVMFMTDGDSDPKAWNGLVHHTDYRFIKYEDVNYRINYTATDTLLRILKVKTNSNVFGIFIAGAERDAIKYTNGTNSKSKFFEENGFILGDAEYHGYDKLFVVSAKQRMENDLSIDSFIENKKKIETAFNAFVKYNKSTINKKVMLTRFVDCISAQIVS